MQISGSHYTQLKSRRQQGSASLYHTCSWSCLLSILALSTSFSSSATDRPPEGSRPSGFRLRRKNMIWPARPGLDGGGLKRYSLYPNVRSGSVRSHVSTTVSSREKESRFSSMSTSGGKGYRPSTIRQLPNFDAHLLESYLDDQRELKAKVWRSGCRRAGEFTCVYPCTSPCAYRHLNEEPLTIAEPCLWLCAV